ncbi:MAG: hypothetical protein IKR57_02575 [Bacilli bacterium]|nr:hypothetical protein [Bacilli bacterium]
MDDLIKDLDKLYAIIGDATDLFDATKMMFKKNETPEAQSIIDSINSFLGEGSFQFVEEKEKKLTELKNELEKTNEKLKEIDANIAAEESAINAYKALADSEEKERLLNRSNNRLESFREEREEILETKESLETKIARLTELHERMKARLARNKKYKIQSPVLKALTSFLGVENLDLTSTLISLEGKEINEEQFDEIFDKFATALNKDMSSEKKAKLKSKLFPYVTSVMGDRELSSEDIDKLKAILAGYKSGKEIEEELHSEKPERDGVPLKPIAESREEGHKASTSEKTRKPERTEGTAMEEEMSPREIAEEQTIAVLMSSGVLPQIELKELENICKQVRVDISEKGLNTILDEEQLHRLLFHKDIRELLLKNSLSDKTDEILNEYNSMIDKYDKLIKDIEDNQISFSPESLAKVKDIREKLVAARDQYISKSNKHVDNVKFKGNKLNDVNSKLSRKYAEYEKFKKAGKEKKMKKVYQQIDKLREKEIKLMSKQVRIANKNCDRFVAIANHQHMQYQRRQEEVLETARQILDYKSEIDERIASNNDIRDNVLLGGFNEGLSRRDIRQANRDIRRNNREIQQLMNKQGRVDRKFQHTKICERLEEYYAKFSR